MVLLETPDEDCDLEMKPVRSAPNHHIPYLLRPEPKIVRIAARNQQMVR
jgi:hypothetical protein